MRAKWRVTKKRGSVSCTCHKWPGSLGLPLHNTIIAPHNRKIPVTIKIKRVWRCAMHESWYKTPLVFSRTYIIHPSNLLSNCKNEAGIAKCSPNAKNIYRKKQEYNCNFIDISYAGASFTVLRLHEFARTYYHCYGCSLFVDVYRPLPKKEI